MSEPQPKRVDYGFGRKDVGAAIERIHAAGTSVGDAARARASLYSVVFNASTSHREYGKDRFVNWISFNKALACMGLNPRRTAMNWDTSISVDINSTAGRIKTNETFSNNFLVMMKLEGERPGIVKELGKLFGINCFTRYTPDLGDLSFLINQYDNRHNRDAPQLFYATAFKSHNPVFDSTGALLLDLQTQLGDNMIVRAHEFDRIEGQKGLIDTLVRSQARYAPRPTRIDGHKLSVGIVRAHSYGDSWDLPGNGLSTTDAFFTETEDDAVDIGPIRNLFTDDAVWILGGCSSGKPGGLANHLANRFGITVIGPEAKGHIRSISVTDDLRLTPQYVDGDVKDLKIVPSREYEPFSLIEAKSATLPQVIFSSN